MNPVDPARTAVLAVHLQEDIVGPNGALAPFFQAEVQRTGVLDTIEQLLNGARRTGAKIVYTRVAFRADYSDMVPNSPLLAMTAQNNSLIDGTPNAEIVAQVAPHAGDTVVTHQRVTGFHASSLDVLLRAAGVDTIVIAGVATNLSVEGTARVASDMGYRTIVVSDGCSAGSKATHQASLESLGLLTEVVTTDEVLAGLGLTHANN